MGVLHVKVDIICYQEVVIKPAHYPTPLPHPLSHVLLAQHPAPPASITPAYLALKITTSLSHLPPYASL